MVHLSLCPLRGAERKCMGVAKGETQTMRVFFARAVLLGTVAAAAVTARPACAAVAAQSADQTNQEAEQQPAAAEATAAPNDEGQFCDRRDRRHGPSHGRAAPARTVRYLRVQRAG